LKAHNDLRDKIIVEVCKEFPKLIRLWPQESGGAFRGERFIRFGVDGNADISGIIMGGYRIEMEVKTGKARQRTTQKNFEKMITNFEGFYKVVRSTSEAVEWVRSVLTLINTDRGQQQGNQKDRF